MAITYEVRKIIVDAVLSGKSHDEARALAGVNVSERSIYRWLEWHREHGDVGLKDNGGFCILPGSREASLPRSPLRTVRESFQSYRSSLSNARFRTRFHNG